MAYTVQITMDAADPAAQAEFWAQALDYVVQPPPPGYDDWPAFLTAQQVPRERWNDASAVVDPDGAGPRIFFQRVPEPKSSKNRVHLDLRAAVGIEPDARMGALEAVCERLVGLGATRLRRVEPGGMSAGFVVMADPEGNEFCLD